MAGGYESAFDRQFREAQERGEFDGPPVVMQLIDVEEVVNRWHSSRSGR